jgi:hypothetical protein
MRRSNVLSFPIQCSLVQHNDGFDSKVKSLNNLEIFFLPKMKEGNDAFKIGKRVKFAEEERVTQRKIEKGRRERKTYKEPGTGKNELKGTYSS